MPDTMYFDTFSQTVDTRQADASYTGAVALVEQGQTINTDMAEFAQATIYDCYGDQQLSITTNNALTLVITRSPTEVRVDFTLSTVVDVDYERCDGAPGHFTGNLALFGSFTFDPRKMSCADLKSWCGDQTPGGGSGFNLDVTSAYSFFDGTAAGNGALMITDSQVDLFSGIVAPGDGAQGVPSVFGGALALAYLFSGDEPFEGISPMDMMLIKAIGAAAGVMVADPTEDGALDATLLATMAGLADVFDYAQLSMAVADVAPSNLALASASDTGAKGDGLTADRTVTIGGLSGKYATVTLMDGDRVVATGRADGSGAFSLTSSTLSDGTHTLTVVAKDASGVSGTSDALTLTVDTKGPGASVAAVSAQGVSGLAESGAKVAVYDGASLLGVTTAGDDGKWSLAASLSARSVHAITAKASDAAGNSATSDGVLFGASWGRLSGGSGDDVLAASPDVTLTGGYGRDLFVFEGAWGRSAVADFRPGWDRVQVDADLADTWSEVRALARQQGSDVVITLDPSHVITLKNVALSSLSGGDFLFG